MTTSCVAVLNGAAHSLLPEGMDDAHLIAAAPALQEAVKRLLVAVGDGGKTYLGERNPLQEAMEFGRTALSIADGDVLPDQPTMFPPWEAFRKLNRRVKELSGDLCDAYDLCKRLNFKSRFFQDAYCSKARALDQERKRTNQAEHDLYMLGSALRIANGNYDHPIWKLFLKKMKDQRGIDTPGISVKQKEVN